MDSPIIITKNLFIGKCPRCINGKIYLEHNYDGDSHVCYVCGYRRELIKVSMPKVKRNDIH